MLDSFKESFLLYCYWVGDYLKRVLVIVSVSGFAISIAVSFYGAFYYAILPSSATYLPLTFNFNSCDIVGQPCSFITSEVLVESKHFPPGLKYNLELVLEVPDTPQNREVGMFLVCTSFSPSEERERLGDERRGEATCVSALLPFHPWAVTVVETFFLLPFILTRVVNSNLETGIELVTGHEGSSLVPSTRAIHIQIESSRLQIQSGVLKVWTNELSGFRYLIYHHPLASSIIGVGSILTVICLLGVICISKFLGPKRVIQAKGVSDSEFPRRTKSNADLADRQARARLTLEYRQELARRHQALQQDDVRQGRSLSTSSVTLPPQVPVMKGLVEGLGPVEPNLRPKFE